MALIKCPECGKEISDKASKCPNCGYTLKSNVLTVIGVIVLILCAILSVLSHGIGFLLVGAVLMGIISMCAKKG